MSVILFEVSHLSNIITCTIKKGHVTGSNNPKKISGI